MYDTRLKKRLNDTQQVIQFKHISELNNNSLKYFIYSKCHISFNYTKVGLIKLRSSNKQELLLNEAEVRDSPIQLRCLRLPIIYLSQGNKRSIKYTNRIKYTLNYSFKEGIGCEEDSQ